MPKQRPERDLYDEHLARLGARINAIRTANGTGQRELSRIANIPPVAIRRIEAGLVDTQIVTLWRLADALGVDVSDFFD